MVFNQNNLLSMQGYYLNIFEVTNSFQGQIKSIYIANKPEIFGPEPVVPWVES